MEDANQDNVCSFCGKKEGEIKKIALSKGRIFICDDCLIEFKEIINGDDTFELPLSVKETRDLELDRKLAELSKKYQIAAIDLDAFEIEGLMFWLLPPSVCTELCIVPVNKNEDALIIAVADPSKMPAVEREVKKFLPGIKIEFLVADEQAIKNAISKKPDKNS